MEVQTDMEVPKELMVVYMSNCSPLSLRGPTLVRDHSLTRKERFTLSLADH